MESSRFQILLCCVISLYQLYLYQIHQACVYSIRTRSRLLQLLKSVSSCKFIMGPFQFDSFRFLSPLSLHYYFFFFPLFPSLLFHHPNLLRIDKISSPSKRRKGYLFFLCPNSRYIDPCCNNDFGPQFELNIGELNNNANK